LDALAICADALGRQRLPVGSGSGRIYALGSGLNDLVDNPVLPCRHRAQLLRRYSQFDASHPLFFQGATSDYNSLQVSFSHRFSKGLVFDGNYTWAAA
jgi:hypothetical protein